MKMKPFLHFPFLSQQSFDCGKGERRKNTRTRGGGKARQERVQSSRAIGRGEMCVRVDVWVNNKGSGERDEKIVF